MTVPFNSFEFHGTLTLDGSYCISSCRHGRLLYSTDDLIGRALSVYGEWAEPQVQLLLQLIGEGDTVIEVGAHIGTTTIPLARRVGPSGRVYAFEPQPLVHQMLCANLALNAIGNVRAIPEGVHDTDAPLVLPDMEYGKVENFGGVSLSADPNAVGETVACRRLDSMIDRLSRCALIKVDVEGMEAAVLRGAEALIGRHRPILYCEVGSLSTFEGVKSFACKLGYEAFWHCFRGFNPGNYRNCQFDIFEGLGDGNVVMFPAEKHINVAGDRAERYSDMHRYFDYTSVLTKRGRKGS